MSSSFKDVTYRVWRRHRRDEQPKLTETKVGKKVLALALKAAAQGKAVDLEHKTVWEGYRHDTISVTISD